jgi:hypothetical protein
MWNKMKNHDDFPFLTLWVVVLAMIVVAFLVAPAAGAQGSDQTCSGGQQVDLQREVYEITVTAPEGQLISGYCVKGGSVQQECGPMYTMFTHPLKTVTIEYDHYLNSCDGKAISHYMTFYTEVPPSTTSSLPPTTIPSTSTSSSPTTSTTTSISPTTTTVVPTTTLPSQVLSAGAARPILGNPKFTG